MWSAGISWDRTGYEVACVHADGRTLRAVRFPADDVAGLAAYVHTACGTDVRAVVESTNGLLDGPLRDAGLRVLRADPWDLPPRPAFGSVPAPVLARRPHESKAETLTETDTEHGTLKGRVGALVRDIERSRPLEAELEVRGLCFSGGVRASRTVALTFDDGPSEPYTSQVLDILARYGVAATFFCVGLHVSAAPALVSRIREDGHTVANHTWSHPYLPDLTRDELLLQLETTNEAVAAATGERPLLVRPPYGSRTPETMRWIAEEGMITVLWNRDTCDWARGGAESIVSLALGPGGDDGETVVLMHDGGGDRSQTVAALPTVIESLLDSGHELVTVDEMLRRPVVS